MQNAIARGDWSWLIIGIALRNTTSTWTNEWELIKRGNDRNSPKAQIALPFASSRFSSLFFSKNSLLMVT